MAKFFENPQNIIIVSASGGGLLLIIIVVLLTVKLARDERRPEQQSDNDVSERNNDGYGGVYQYVQGEEMTEIQTYTSRNGQPGEPQTRDSGANENG